MHTIVASGLTPERGDALVTALQKCMALGFTLSGDIERNETKGGHVSVSVRWNPEHYLQLPERLPCVNLPGLRGLVRCVAGTLEVLHGFGFSHGGVKVLSLYQSASVANVVVSLPNNVLQKPASDMRALGDFVDSLFAASTEVLQPECCTTLVADLRGGALTAHDLLYNVAWLELPPLGGGQRDCPVSTASAPSPSPAPVCKPATPALAPVSVAVSAPAPAPACAPATPAPIPLSVPAPVCTPIPAATPAPALVSTTTPHTESTTPAPRLATPLQERYVPRSPCTLVHKTSLDTTSTHTDTGSSEVSPPVVRQVNHARNHITHASRFEPQLQPPSESGTEVSEQSRRRARNRVRGASEEVYREERRRSSGSQSDTTSAQEMLFSEDYPRQGGQAAIEVYPYHTVPQEFHSSGGVGGGSERASSTHSHSTAHSQSSHCSPAAVRPQRGVLSDIEATLLSMLNRCDMVSHVLHNDLHVR